MLVKASPNSEFITTPSVCLYMILLKMNFTPDMAFLSIQKRQLWK